MQRGLELERSLEATCRIPVHRPVEHALEILGKVLPQLSGRPRNAREYRDKERIVVRRSERALAGERLVEHDTARVEVDARIEVSLAARLLWSEIVRRAHDHP